MQFSWSSSESSVRFWSLRLALSSITPPPSQPSCALQEDFRLSLRVLTWFLSIISVFLPILGAIANHAQCRRLTYFLNVVRRQRRLNAVSNALKHKFQQLFFRYRNAHSRGNPWVRWCDTVVYSNVRVNTWSGSISPKKWMTSSSEPCMKFERELVPAWFSSRFGTLYI